MSPGRRKGSEKEKQAELRGVRTTCAQKYCCVGKGSVVVLSLIYLRVTKKKKGSRAWQGKARHEEARGGRNFILTESVTLHFTIQVEQVRSSQEMKNCRYIS